MSWVGFVVDLVWANVWAVVPPALGAAAVCRWVPCRPVTRHAVWLVVLAWFLVPPLLPAPPSAQWLDDADGMARAITTHLPGREPARTEPIRPGAAGVSGLSDGAAETARALPEHLAGETRTLPAGATDTRQPTAPRPYRNPRADRTLRRPHDIRKHGPSYSVRTLPSGSSTPASKGIRDGFAGLSGDSGNRPRCPLRSGGDGNANGAPSQRVEAAPSAEDRVSSTRGHASLTEGGLAVSAVDAGPRRVGVRERYEPEARATGQEDPALRLGARTGVPLDRARSSDDQSVRQRVGGPVAPGVPADPEPRATIGERWRAWLAAALVLRELLGSLPAIPAGLWLGGAATVVLWSMLRIWCFRRRLRCGQPAPTRVVREMTLIARRLNLRRLPEVLMVPDRVAPLVWCGWKPRLIIPTRLWAELDRSGRRAILCHELAHLRRRDHWVIWLELLVSALWWWHPVVWWARRRLHEEADMCCDAWVTWLMPRGRRAFAEALLKTKRYIDTEDVNVPAVGIAVTTSGARRLARRLTMVMTQSVGPRHSFTGVAVATVLVLAGWMVTPALSCPPKEKAQSGVCEAGSLEDGPSDVACDDKKPPKIPEAPKAPKPPKPPEPPKAPRLGTAGTTQAEKAASTFESYLLRRGARGGSVDDDALIVRKYRLPSGKLEALSELMIRSDVPIRVRPLEDAIEVHATAAEHQVFAAFVELIDPEGDHGVSTRGGWAGIRARPGGTAELYTRALKGYSRAQKQTGDSQALVGALRSQARARLAQREQRVRALLAQVAAIERQAEAVESKSEGLLEQAERICERAEALEKGSRQKKTLERQARDLERQARQLEKQAEQLQRQAAELEEQADKQESQRDEMQDQFEDLDEYLQTLRTLLRPEPGASGRSPRAPRRVTTGRVSRPIFQPSETATAWEGELKVAVAAALREAARALRQQAAPQVREAFETAADALRAEWRTQVREALDSLRESVGEQASPLTAELLEEATSHIQSVAAEAIVESIEHAAEVLEAKAAELGAQDRKQPERRRVP